MSQKKVVYVNQKDEVVGSGPVVIDNDEVANYRWISPPKLNRWIQKTRENLRTVF